MSYRGSKTLLSILVFVVLVYSLYRFRAKIDESTKLKQPLFWSEIGKNCFVSQPLFILGYFYWVLIQIFLSGQFQIWSELYNIFLYPFDIFISTELRTMNYSIIFYGCYFVAPILSACLTYKKLVKPLNEEKIPNRKWFHLILILAVSPIVAVILWMIVVAIPSMYGIMWIIDGLIQMLLFSLLIMGTIAIEISCHKLYRKHTDLIPLACDLPK